MSPKLIKSLLLVEDNLGDARLFRETFKEQGSHDTELTYANSMSEERSILQPIRLTLSYLTWGCPIHKDWKRSGGLMQPRPGRAEDAAGFVVLAAARHPGQ